MTELPRKITDDPYGAAALIRRLIAEQGLQHWRRYAVAFALMAVSAGATAASAWMLGAVINETYVNRSVHGIVMLSLVIIDLDGHEIAGRTVFIAHPDVEYRIHRQPNW